MKKIKICFLAAVLFLITMNSIVFAGTKSVFPGGVGVAIISNNYNGNSTITFNGKFFKTGDQLRIYGNSNATYQIVTPPPVVNQYLDDVIVQLPQLGLASGSLYVTLQSIGGNEESYPVKIDYDEEVTATNNVDIPDTVRFAGLKAKDIAKVYAADTTTVLGTATAAVDGNLIVTLSKKLPELNQGGSSVVYVTVKSDRQTEGPRRAVIYYWEKVTATPVGVVAVGQKPADIIVVNNVTLSDKITFLGLKAKDVAKVYASDGTTVIGTATAAKDGNLDVVLAKQLNESAKVIYVSVKNYNLRESPLTMVQYYREGQTPAPDISNVIVTNTSFDSADIVTFRNLKDKDVATVYAADHITLLGTATATSDGYLNVTLAYKLPQPSAGTIYSVYVTVKSALLLESSQIPVYYSSVVITATPNASNMIATSNFILVSGVNENDIVTVYDSVTGSLIGMAKVPYGENYVIINFISTNRSVYVKNKNPNRLISASSFTVYLP
jgi:hypothetical protein